MNILKQALSKRGAIIALARASGIHSARFSLILNQRLKPEAEDVAKMEKGLVKLGMDRAIAGKFAEGFTLDVEEGKRHR